MSTRKLNGPLGGEYLIDGTGNAILMADSPITDDNRLGARLTTAEAAIALTEPQMRAGRALEGLLRPRLPLAYPYQTAALTSDTPTVTHSLSATITSNYFGISAGEKGIAYEGLSYVAPVWNATYSFWDHRERGITGGGSVQSTMNSVAFTLIGDTVEIDWRVWTTEAVIWIWVDGKPISVQPVAPSGVTLSANIACYTKLVFGSAGVRTIQFQLDWGQVRNFRVPNSGSIMPAVGLGPKVYGIGDSILEASTGNFTHWSSWGPIVARSAGWRFYNAGQGGSGYTTDGASGQKLTTLTSRPQNIVLVDPDLAVFFIGVNDAAVDAATLTAAVASVFAYLNTNAPNVPIVVVGGAPTSAASIFLTTARVQSRKAIRDGVLAYPNVIGFIDPVGDADTGTTPSALTNGTTYAVGDRYTYLGALWEVTEAHTATATPTYKSVKRLTWLYGTGLAGGATGNGNRDVLLSNDGVHPTQAGQNAYAAWIAQGVANCIQHWLKTGQRLGLS